LFIDLFSPVLKQSQESLHLEAWYHVVEAFFDVFFDLVLVVVEDAHILDFVLLGVFKKVAVLPHKIGLELFEFGVYNNLLESGDNLVEEDLLGR
jgi:hypothetical protein